MPVAFFSHAVQVRLALYGRNSFGKNLSGKVRQEVGDTLTVRTGTHNSPPMQYGMPFAP